MRPDFLKDYRWGVPLLTFAERPRVYLSGNKFYPGVMTKRRHPQILTLRSYQTVWLVINHVLQCRLTRLV